MNLNLDRAQSYFSNYSQEDSYYSYEDDCDLNQLTKQNSTVQTYLFGRDKFTQYIVETKDEIFSKIKDDLSYFVQEKGLSRGQALKLLKQLNFDSEKAHIKLMSDTTIFELLQNDLANNSKPENPYTCPCCYEEYDLKDCYSLSCNHYFCKDCFREYLISALKEGPICIQQTCPYSGCLEFLTDDTYKQLLDEKEFQRYMQFLVETVVTTSKYYQWCPKPNCDQAIKYSFDVSTQEKINVKCKCNHIYCSSCRNDAHRPLTCKKTTEWIQLIEGKSGNLDAQWIKINTKECPNCKTNIQKNEGCMHMTCRTCGHEFCWLCLKNWKQLHSDKTGGYYACNMYKEENDSGLDQTKKQLNKYNFYSDRFLEHKKSLKQAEQKFKQKINEFELVCDIIDDQFMSSEFLVNALETVIEARRAIAYSQGCSYFISNKSKKELFEFQYCDLQHSLELLDQKTDIDFEKYQEDLKVGNETKQILSQDFYKLKEEIIKLTNIIVKQYQKIINSSESEDALMEIEDPYNNDDNDIKYINYNQEKNKTNSGWICSHCTIFNENQEARVCFLCESAR